jgi:hypothetical protein
MNQCIYYDAPVNSFALSFAFLHYKLFTVLMKRKTYCSGHIQRYVLLLQQSSKQCVCVSLPQGTQVTRRRRSHCWSAPDSYALARVSHGSDPSQYDKGAVIFDGSPFTIGERPCKHVEAGVSVLGQQQGWVGWGGMTQREEAMTGVGGGGVDGEPYVQVKH